MATRRGEACGSGCTSLPQLVLVSRIAGTKKALKIVNMEALIAEEINVRPRNHCHRGRTTMFTPAASKAAPV